jgi:hypothetical protein
VSVRFLVIALVLAAALTAVTYMYTTETEETLSDPGLTDLQRMATVHGWPWGYIADVTEMVRISEGRVAVLEYVDLRWQMLGQTMFFWLVIALIFVSLLIVLADPRRGRI